MWWSLLQMVISTGFVLALSACLFYPLRLDNRPLNALAFGFVVISVATAYLLLIGLVGLLRPAWITLVSTLGLVAIALVVRRRGFVFLGILRIAPRGEWRLKPKRPWTGFVFLALLQLTWIGVLVWYLPPYVWDVTGYHLPNMAEWIQRGRITTFDTPVLRSYWPANFEIFETWFAIFLHHDLVVELAGVLFYLLASGSVFAICRTIGLNRRLSAFGALLYAYTPSVAIHATSCNNDLPIAAVYLFIVALLLDWIKNKPEKTFRTWPGILLLVMVFSLALGTKAYIVFIMPGLLWLAVVASGKGAGKRAIFEFGPPVFLLFLVVGISLLLGFYWYLRNWAQFHNPFYPADFRLFGRFIFGTGQEPSSLAQPGPSLRSLMESLRQLFTYKIFDSRGAINADLNDITGWGWFAFACGLPALVYSLSFSKKIRILAIGWGLSLVGLLLFVLPDQWNMRFTLWFPALFAIAFVLSLRRLRLPLMRTIWIGLAVVCMLLNFVARLNLGRISPTMFARMGALSPLRRSTAQLQLYIGPRYKNALALIPLNETIGYNMNEGGWVYPLYDADFSRNLQYLSIDEGTDVPEKMQAYGVKYLFLPSRWLTALEVKERVQQFVRQGRLKKLADGVYRISQGNDPGGS